MARWPAWTTGTIIWGDKILQASQFADDSNPHVNPRLNDYDFNALRTDYLSQTDAIAQNLKSSLTIAPSGTMDAVLVADDSGISGLHTLRLRSGASSRIDFLAAFQTIAFSANPTGVAYITPAAYENNLTNRDTNILSVDVGNTFGFGVNALLWGDDGTKPNPLLPGDSEQASGPNVFLTALQQNVSPGVPATVGTANAAGAGKGVPWIDHVHKADHALLDGVLDNDTVATTAARGMLVVGNATPKFAGLVLGSAGQYPRSNGTDLLYSAPLSSDLSGRIGQANALSGTEVTVSDDETQASGPVAAADTDVKTFALPANTYTTVETYVDGYVSTAAKNTLQTVNLKIKYGTTQIGNIMKFQAVAAGVAQSPFAMTVAGAQQAAATIHFTQGAAAADASTTVFCNTMKVRGLV